jgi:protein-L-isoaspartate O-methyltransferase
VLLALRKRLLESVHSELLKETFALTVGDARLGLPSKAPFDAIHCGARVDDVPKPWLQQLRVGGALVTAVTASKRSVEDPAKPEGAELGAVEQELDADASLVRVRKLPDDRVLITRLIDHVDYEPLREIS